MHTRTHTSPLTITENLLEPHIRLSEHVAKLLGQGSFFTLLERIGNSVKFGERLHKCVCVLEVQSLRSRITRLEARRVQVLHKDDAL